MLTSKQISAEELCRKIAKSIQADKVEFVNDIVTEDSVVEHNIDTDVIIDGHVYNVTINVSYFGKVDYNLD